MIEEMKMSYLDKPWLKHYPPEVPHEVNPQEVALTQLIDETIKKNSKKTALMFYGTKITYQKLGISIDKMASKPCCIKYLAIN